MEELEEKVVMEEEAEAEAEVDYKRLAIGLVHEP